MFLALLQCISEVIWSFWNGFLSSSCWISSIRDIVSLSCIASICGDGKTIKVMIFSVKTVYSPELFHCCGRGKDFMSMWCLFEDYYRCAVDMKSSQLQECTLKNQRDPFRHRRQLMRTLGNIHGVPKLHLTFKATPLTEVILGMNINTWRIGVKLKFYRHKNNLQCKTIFRPACVAASHCQHVSKMLNWSV